MKTLTVERIESPNADARLLIGELDDELNADYPPEQRHGFSVERVFQPDVLFFVARLDGEPVGCGGGKGDGGRNGRGEADVRPSGRAREERGARNPGTDRN